MASRPRNAVAYCVLFKNGVPWTAVCGGGLVILAAMPLFHAPYAVFSISAPLGKALYLAALFTLVGGGVLAATRERADEAARHATTQTMLKSFMESVDRRLGGSVFSGSVTETLSAADLQTASGAMSLPTPSLSGKGVTITPGTGRLEIEGFAPTISVEALDQEIREKGAALLKHLADEDSGSWAIDSQIAARQLNAQEAATRTAAVLKMQDIVNAGDTEFPASEDKKKD